MKHLIIFLFLTLTFGCSHKDQYDPDKLLSEGEQLEIIKKTIRYSVKLAPRANHETKFEKSFDWYYDKAVEEYDVRRYFISEDSTNFFLFTRVARSITPMREAIGGKLKMDQNKNILDYEEVFRTWKMNEDSLNVRAYELFDKLVKNEDLTSYRAKYKGDRYIEFPDDRFYFDKQARLWRDKIMDAVRVNQ